MSVAFEVDGRVSYVVESGTLLEGRWEEDGKVHAEMTVKKIPSLLSQYRGERTDKNV